MEFSFTVNTQKPELITNEEYPLFWCGNKYTTSPDNIGTCKVKVENSEVYCTAIITTSGIKHTINNVTIAEFTTEDIFAGKYKYGILFKDDQDGNEYVYGFCLSRHV